MPITTIRLHSYTTTPGFPVKDGTDHCDFRGTGFVGAAQGDNHHTLVELDLEDTDPRVDQVLTFGPAANKALRLLEGKVVSGIHGKDQIPGLRIGVWDKIAPDAPKS